MSPLSFAQKQSASRSTLLALISAAASVGVILAILIYFDVHLMLVDILEWVNEQGVWAAVLFILIMATVVIFLLPGIFFTAGAGYVFGTVEGTIYVVVGSTLGAGVAFLIARHFFGPRARDFVLARSKLDFLNRNMARHDFRIVLLTRLIPFFPGKISNYFFGVTRFSFRGYMLGTAIGFIPFSLHNVYLGSLAQDLAALSEGELARSPMQWAVYGLGLAVAVMAIIYISNLARNMLAEYSEQREVQD